MVISTSKITYKRQITLPIKVMSRLKLNPGDNVVFEERNGRVEIKSVSDKFTVQDFIKKHRGVTNKKFSDKQIKEARAQAWLSRIAS